MRANTAFRTLRAGRFRGPYAAVVLAIVPVTISAYEPDPESRKTIADQVRTELIERTPRAARLGIRLGMARNIAFNDYERIADTYGYAPYADCTIASFVEVSSWQIATGVEAEVAAITKLYQLCEASETTSLGPKPLPQSIGDREIMRAIWQRNLEAAGTMGDAIAADRARSDAAARFRELRGEPNQWALTASSGFAPISPTPEPSVQTPGTTEGAESAPTEVAVAVDPDPAPVPVPPTANGIERIVLRTTTGYGLSGVYITNATYLLFQDGAIFRRPYANPHTLNVASSRREHPDDWGRWQRRGDTLEVTWTGDAARVWETWHTARPAEPGRRISGVFQSADPFGGAEVINFNTVAFDAGGRFSWAVVKGGDTAWLPVYSSSDSAGRYELDGYSIRLLLNDGSVQEHAFAFYPNDDEHFVIGANHFVPLD